MSESIKMNGIPYGNAMGANMRGFSGNGSGSIKNDLGSDISTGKATFKGIDVQSPGDGVGVLNLPPKTHKAVRHTSKKEDYIKKISMDY